MPDQPAYAEYQAIARDLNLPCDALNDSKFRAAPVGDEAMAIQQASQGR